MFIFWDPCKNKWKILKENSSDISEVQAHSAAVIDIVNVPGRPNEILTFSGDTQVKYAF